MDLGGGIYPRWATAASTCPCSPTALLNGPVLSSSRQTLSFFFWQSECSKNLGWGWFLIYTLIFYQVVTKSLLSEYKGVGSLKMYSRARPQCLYCLHNNGQHQGVSPRVLAVVRRTVTRADIRMPAHQQRSPYPGAFLLTPIVSIYVDTVNEEFWTIPMMSYSPTCFSADIWICV